MPPHHPPLITDPIETHVWSWKYALPACKLLGIRSANMDRSGADRASKTNPYISEFLLYEVSTQQIIIADSNSVVDIAGL